MRIGIDARFYGPANKGLGRYTQEIVDGVIRSDQENEYVIFLYTDNYNSFCCPNERVSKVLAPVRWYTLAEQFVMPRLIREQGIDLMHIPHFNVPIFMKCPFIVTIHDLILTKFPTMRATTLGPIKYWLKNILYRIVISSAMKKAKKIIAVSDFTKHDIMDKFGISSDRITVIYEGVAEMKKNSESPEQKDDSAKYFLETYKVAKYLLYVGNAYPHKNLEMLIDVFADLHAEDSTLRLILVGKEDYFYGRLHEYASRKNLWKKSDLGSPVIFTGYVSDRCLRELYVQALCYVFPSLYEGFGLPPLEAMRESCPVLSTDRACMKEILGSAALYFNPEEKEDIKKRIKQLFLDPDLRNDLIAKGKLQCAKYSWKQSVQDTLKLYRS